MAAKIFISYRRSDDHWLAQALFGRLRQAFSSVQLFMDVDNIEPGLDFVRVLNEQVEQCDVHLRHNSFGPDTGTLISALQSALEAAEGTRAAKAQEAAARQQAEEERKRQAQEAAARQHVEEQRKRVAQEAAARQQAERVSKFREQEAAASQRVETGPAKTRIKRD
jgi:hypothetical protein